jgi:diguanylate cyclase
LQAANAKLEELSATDQLTGVRNRRYLDRVLQEEYARAYRYRDNIAVMLLDIDHFKRFNDVWGHQVGDDCLRQVAAVLMEAVRAPIDHVARYGGEEFCIVMPQTGAEGAAVVAERIRQAVQDMDFVVDGERLPVTISIGLAAHIPQAMEGSRELLKQADMALYQAKGEGRNRVVMAAA